MQLFRDLKRSWSYRRRLERFKAPSETNASEDIRVYVLVRPDLPAIPQGIQAAHALSELWAKAWRDPELGASMIDWARDHKTLILLAASEWQMKDAIARWQYLLPTAYFIEPDLNDSLTATAFAPISRWQGRFLFGHLRRAV